MAETDIENKPQKLATIVLSSEQLQHNYNESNAKTALPIALSIKETPQSISVINRQRLDDQQLKHVIDVAENTTGIVTQRNESNRGSIYSRGFQVDNYQIDGIPTTYSNRWSGGEIFNSTALVERVEVVRGATGLLTGAGNPSAAINMIRKSANKTEPSAQFEVGLGSWNHYQLLADVANRLNQDGSWRGRAVLSIDDTDSFLKNYNKQSFAALLSTEFDLSEQTQISAGLSHQQDRSTSPTWGALPAVMSNGQAIDWSIKTSLTPNWSYWDTDYSTLFTKLKHRFNNNWIIEGSYEYGERGADSKLMYFYGSPNPDNASGVSAGFGQFFTETKQSTANLQLSGDFNAFQRQHEFALGYNYSDQKFSADYRPTKCLNQSTNPSCDFRIPNFFDFDFYNIAQPDWDTRRVFEKQNIKQNSIYSMTRLSLAEPLKLILGARLTDYEKTGYVMNNKGFIQKFDNQFIPYAGLVYNLSPEWSAYTSFTSIFQPQSRRDASGQYIDPIEGNNYELGLKGSFYDQRLNASAALFRIEQDNFAVLTGELVDFGQGPESVYRAANGATSTGFEFEVNGQILPQWNITAGYAQFDLKDANGKAIDRQRPNKTAHLFTHYDFSQHFAPLSIGAGMRWQNATYFPVIAGEIKQDAYAVFDLMSRYKISPEIALQLNIRNLTDKKSYTIASQQVNFNEPRNVNLLLSYKF